MTTTRSKIDFHHGHAILAFHNGVAEMQHTAFAGAFLGADPKAKALKYVAALQPSVEEGLSLAAPEGYVFAGVNELTQSGQAVKPGFRRPARASRAEKETDARLGAAAWLLFRLSTGYDATFVPVESDWDNVYAAPRGAGARVCGSVSLFA